MNSIHYDSYMRYMRNLSRMSRRLNNCLNGMSDWNCWNNYYYQQVILIQLLNNYWEVELNLIMQSEQTYISEQIRDASGEYINPSTIEGQAEILEAIDNISITESPLIQ